MDITIKTLFGLEELLAKEIKEMGASEITVGNRVVLCKGDKRLLYNINLRSRLALRVMVPLLKFRAHNETVFYKRLRRYKWTDLIDLDQTFAINSAVFSDIFRHSHYISLKVKDAINDQFRDLYDGRRPNIDLKSPDISIDVHCTGKDFTLSLDSSSSSLHRRGYRQSKRIAPLNEVLASGLIMLAEWDGQSPLYDPMCGSGTILTEAYQIAKNIPPGVGREHFGFMNWDDYDRDLWMSVLDEAQQSIKTTMPLIYGFDIDGIQINETNALLKEIGYDDGISINQKDFFGDHTPEVTGTIICNPPYDDRVKVDNIDNFYKSIGDTLKKHYNGWDAWILSGNKSALKKLGLRTSKRLHLYNGSIECKYHKYEMYRGSKKTKTDLSEQG